MITDIERELAAGMHDEVDGLALTRDIVAQAARRHRVRTTVHRTAYAAGVVGLAGALAVGLAAGNGGTHPGVGKPPVASAESPRLQLAAAAAASQNISYKVKVTCGTKTDPGGMGTTQGAIDPATDTGYLNTTYPSGGAVYYERLINGVRYIGSSGSQTWKQEPGTFENLGYDEGLGVGTSADPKQLFDALQQADATVTKTGARTYHFESTKAYDTQYATGQITFTGDVTLDGGNRIATVTYESTDKGQMKPGVKGGAAFESTYAATTELSDYGLPVVVEKPTKVVVVR